MILPRALKGTVFTVCILFFGVKALPAWDVSADAPSPGYLRLARGPVVVWFQPPERKVASQYLDWALGFIPRPDF
ncbi:MAG: hypothetical protein U9N45_00330, partial [Gemmatimonadota bacterium]|nr:hypothetical protein [Gemmatimonadota bacterium]